MPRARPQILLLTVLLALLLFLPAVAAQEDIKGQQWETLPENDAKQVTTTQQGFLDRILNVFSLVQVQTPVVNPGGELTLDVSLSSSVDYIAEPSETTLVVETYHCADSSCNDPYGDRLVEFLSFRSPTAIDRFGGTGPYAYYRALWTLDFPKGTIWLKKFNEDGTVDRVQEEVPEGYYATVMYVIDTSTNQVISDVWTRSNPNEQWRATYRVETQDPKLVVSREPSVSVSENVVESTVGFENVGGPIGFDAATGEPRAAVEMQVVPTGTGPLSTVFSFVSGQQVCDLNNPNAVHKNFQLDSGESTVISLSRTVEPDQRYDVYLGTATDCLSRSSERIEPYPQAVKVGTVCVGDCSEPVDLPVETLLLFGLGIVFLVGYGVYRYG